MRRELTVISVLLLGLLADSLFFLQTPELGFNSLFQLGLAIFSVTFIVIAGKKYLAGRFYLDPKFSLFSIWKYFRSRFRPEIWKDQIPSPRV